METVEKLLLRNLAEVFGEADSSKRAEAIAWIWAQDGELIDPQGLFVGHNAVSAVVGELHARFPGFVSHRSAPRRRSTRSDVCGGDMARTARRHW